MKLPSALDKLAANMPHVTSQPRLNRAFSFSVKKGRSMSSPRLTAPPKIIIWTAYARNPTPMAAKVPRGMLRMGFLRSPDMLMPAMIPENEAHGFEKV